MKTPQKHHTSSDITEVPEHSASLRRLFAPGTQYLHQCLRPAHIPALHVPHHLRTCMHAGEGEPRSSRHHQ